MQGVIRTERLELRPLRMDDLEAYVAMHADPRVADWIGGVRTREETTAWLEAHIEASTARGYGQLTVREREIVRLRFQDDLTQAEIGQIVGLSQMHVSRVLRTALDKLRHIAETEMRVAAGPTRRTDARPPPCQLKA